MDISSIFEAPNLSEKVKLIITPLAPLSMVSEIPGSYYISEKKPSKFHLSGLLENILGWHISNEDRLSIQKEIKKVYLKQYKIKDYKNAVSNSGYIPLLYHLFDIKLVMAPTPMHYDDIWKKAFRRADAIVHPNGTPNIDFDLIKVKRSLKRKEDKPLQIDEKEMEILFKSNLGKFPYYYTTVSKREYLKFEGVIQISLEMQKGIYNLLVESIEENNLVYLGTNDGWTDVKIEML
ncbi:type I-PGING CRISPR-associated protein Cas5p [Arcticibacter eurypsychrophilus]|uniref:type I-PGING CRISPR-associated protein Cas5p n=1 Tax=Arcticibacter eurypsychrophilus TaxID=1434752 RepID=UPI00084DADBD|nr:type I-PGING CRISPR-associated protein Cas5p [Arcticibacter eurypsychrophilus]